MKKVSNDFTVLKDIYSLSIYRFCMIHKTRDYRFLIKEYHENDTKAFVNYKSNTKLKAIFDNVDKEHKGAIGDKRSLTRAKELFELKALNQKYSLISQILNLYNETKEIEVLGALEESKWGFSIFKPIGPQLDFINKKMIGLKNTINIKEAKFKEKYKISEDDDDSGVDIIDALHKRALQLEVALSLGRPIKIKKTSVIDWVNLSKIEEAKREQNG